MYLCILPYMCSLMDILGRLAQGLLVSYRERRILVQRFKSIKVKDKNRLKVLIAKNKLKQIQTSLGGSKGLNAAVGEIIVIS